MSLHWKLHTLKAGAFWRKMSIEKSVNFLQPGGTFLLWSAKQFGLLKR
jgi:hypothetical protein